MIERAARGAAPAGLALLAVIGVVTNQRPLPVGIALVVIVAVSGAAIEWRRITGWPLVVALAVPTAALVAACHGESSANLGWFGMCVIAGWLALDSPVTPAVAGCVGLVAVFAAEWIGMPEEPGWAAWAAGTVFTTMACAFTRRQRELVEQLRAAQAGLADRVRADERNRVAAEMHDVVGHALTVSLLHVGSARLALDDDPEQARESLEKAERLARASLDEVRSAVGVLRADQTGTVAPMPSATDIPELVESFRRAGSSVELVIDGDIAGLGATRGLAVYRIVQESLTNAARHGDGSAVRVTIATEETGTTVTIVNGAVAAADHESGTGLVAMRERAEAIGGRLVAGEHAGRWQVEAVIPA